ncbi:porin OmpC [Edwardsiella ictaluri]|uniref:Porin OmpC n=1 Tax=Edwardsiella ictaluri TaxID=67780 RepID=A0ABY8GG17_EDWIC|nr:porin OmpC [Edwardsiella ictaluri]ELV7529442.1 porin OmpC [Edwardsiella ictaluri]KMQ77802.1 porin [Edwardsiella ictaluri]KOO54624.1 porin [Edwardsiella ictaluri]WFN96258.1 porin OmpC [Edwardsiella ictaluri]
MKRNLLAAVIPALLVAGAANAAEIYNKDGNKLDLYGKVDGLHYFSQNHSVDGDQSYVRFGFKGETQINDQLTGYGQWEAQANVNQPESNSSNFFTRLGFAGLKYGNYGSIDYGRNYGVLYDIEGWTDVLPEFGGDTSAQSDNFMTQRANNLATYRNNGFFGLVDGLNLALQYQGKNDGKSKDGQKLSNNARDEKQEQNGDGFGLSTTYDLGWGISAGAAYTTSNRTTDQKWHGNQPNVAGGNKAQSWGAGLKYDANNIYLATMYTETQNMTPFGSTGIANKAKNFEAVAQYQFDFGLRPSIAYLQSRASELNAYNGFNGGKADLVKYVDLGATYYFNKNMSTYVDYKINLLDNNDFTRANSINTDDIVALGLVYQF